MVPRDAPFADWRSTGVTPEAAYLKLERDYHQIAREQIVCGCHIHVGMPDREQRPQVLNVSGPWLSPILALSVNSPFWEGVDTATTATARKSGRAGRCPARPTLPVAAEYESWSGP